MELTFIPEGLNTATAVFLLLSSVITSMITASLGAGGGVLLLVLMAFWIPPAAIIPVQGLGGLSKSNLCCLALLPDHTRASPQSESIYDEAIYIAEAHRTFASVPEKWL